MLRLSGRNPRDLAGLRFVIRGLWQALGLMGSLLIAAELAQAVECKNQTVINVTFTTCRVDLHLEVLHLYWRDEAGKPYGTLPNLRDVLAKEGKTLTFAMNAGMYQEDLAPLGLFVSDHRELARLNHRKGLGNFYQPPNGVFLVEDAGARVVTTEEYADTQPHPLLATQSGPILVYHGAITESPVMNPQSTSLRIRNGVCTPSPDTAVFVISDSPVTFYDFARFFLDKLGCREALYLDGSVSSLYAPSIGRADYWRDLGPMFGVTE
jgi:uncharacterized protein YigE (DUF2233 family)